MTDLTGEQLTLSAGPWRAVVTEVGAGLREVTFNGRRVLDGYLPDQPVTGARGQHLLPWPNRVDHGRYTFDGESRQLDLTEPERDCAIHGLVRWGRFHPESRGADHLVMTHRLHGRPGYPHVLDVRIAYRLHPDRGLEVEVAATNAGSRPAPYGYGAHPYLTCGEGRIDDWELRLPASQRLDTDARGIPTRVVPVEGTPFDFRAPRAIGALQIDYAFGHLTRDLEGRATVELRDPGSGATSALWVDGASPWLEIFTGDTLPDRPRHGLGVEPMTCPPNAFVSGEGVVRLEPGASHTARWGVDAR